MGRNHWNAAPHLRTYFWNKVFYALFQKFLITGDFMNQYLKDKLCSYGCGQPAVVMFKNGKCCCSSSRNQCPVIREKNAKSNTGSTRDEASRKKLSEATKGRKLSLAKLFNNTAGILCSYGCGKVANFVFDNGMYCCNENWHRCDAKKRENAKRKVEEFKDPARKEKHRISVENNWKKRNNE